MSAQTAQTAPPPLTLDDLRIGPPTISVERAGHYLGVSRAYAYAMAREGRLPTIKLGTRRVRDDAVRQPWAVDQRADLAVVVAALVRRVPHRRQPDPAVTVLAQPGRAVIAVVSHLCGTVGWVVSQIGPASVL